MNKTQNSTELLESEEEQKKWLRDYPAAKPKEAEDAEGRVYLEDFYSRESMEIDKLLYLALQNRVGISLRKIDSKDELNYRKRFYLTKAFGKFRELIQRENIQSFAEYDNKYTIHFFCDEWTGVLCELLKEKRMKESCRMCRKSVKRCSKALSTEKETITYVQQPGD